MHTPPLARAYTVPAGTRAMPLQAGFRLLSTAPAAPIEAAVRGFGITRLLSYQVAPQLATGALKIVLGDYEPAPRPVHIVHREGRYAAATVRAFVDLLAARLRADSALN